jgi:raffinose/stachyose/melibiose transport system substrate-binding protein
MSKPRKLLSVIVSVFLLTSLLAACGGGSSEKGDNPSASNKGKPSSSAKASDKPTEKEKVTISFNNGSDSDKVKYSLALIDAFQKKYPYITVEHETRPAGTEGDNFIKTRMATGDMNDVFFYNAGSLFLALNPEENLLDMTNEPFMDNVIDSYKPVVSEGGKVYGIPAGTTMGGGWLYNKKIYAELGLSIPKSWAELMENNKKIKAAGITAMIGTYKDSWTSQLIVLADYYNVQAGAPNFAADYTANKAKYATTPSALRSFEKIQEAGKEYMNKDYLATTFDAGLKMLAEGKGAHYPMLTFAVPTIAQNNPDQLNDIGFFAQPGDSADKNGMTVWMPDAGYIYKNSKHIEEAKLFLEFVLSPEGVAAWTSVSTPMGPWAIKGATLPDNVAPAVKDMLPYIESGNSAPALEFLSPIKGPSLEQITVEVGSGRRSAADAAAMYDKDVNKQAKQLGLEGW